jgi:hypothetical protein
VVVLSGPKRVIFGRFVGVKIYVCVISHNLSLGDGRQIRIGMLNSAWIAVGDKPKMFFNSFNPKWHGLIFTETGMVDSTPPPLYVGGNKSEGLQIG